MNAVWPYDRCIVCLERTVLTRSHVIPEAVGGQLWTLFECGSCNGRLGSTIEAGLKLDPCVRLGIEAVADQVPDLASGMRRRAPFVGIDRDVHVRGRWADGDFGVCATPQADGSIVKAHDDADQDIRRRLRKRGAGDAEIAAAIERWERAPHGQSASLGRGIAIRNSSVGPFAPEIRAAHRAPDECLLAIAYRFLALVIGAAIYSPTLEGIRAGLREAGGGRREARAGTSSGGSSAGTTSHGTVCRSRSSNRTSSCGSACCQIAWDVAFTDVRLGTAPIARSYVITLDGEVAEHVA